MFSASAYALLASMALSPDAPGWEASIRAESRVRNGSALDADGRRAGDLELAPRLGLVKTGPRAVWGAQYAANLRWNEFYASSRWDHFHSGQLNASFQMTSQTRTWVRAGTTYGFLDLITLYRRALNSAGASLSPQLPPTGLQEFTLEGAAGAEMKLSEVHQLEISALFNWGGGLRTADQATLPLQRSPQLAARHRVQISPRTRLGVNAAARWTHFLPNRDSASADLAAAWEFQLSRQWNLSASAGLSALHNRDGASPALQQVLPLGQLAILSDDRDIRQRWSANASVEFGPFVDRFSAQAYPRAEARVFGLYRLTPEQSAQLGAGLALALPQSGAAIPAQAWFGYGELALVPWSNGPFRWDLTARLGAVTATPAALVQWALGTAFSWSGRGNW